MTDPYLDDNLAYNRLKRELDKYGKLYIAFDYDNTIYDYHNEGHTYTNLISILKLAKELGHILILFTANTGERLKKIEEHCVSLGITPDMINENTDIGEGIKPYYNILLDDRAGLSSAYKTLHSLLIRN